MTKENKTLLENALFESTSQEIKEIDDTNLPDFSPSADFKRKIYSSHIKKKIITPKRIFIAIMVLLIATIIIMVSTSNDKEPVYDYIIDISNNAVSLSVSDKLKDATPREIELAYSPLNSMLNHGYKLKSRDAYTTEIINTFTNEEKNTDIELKQSVISGITITLDQSLEEPYREIYIDNTKLYLFERDTRSVIVWMHAEYEFFLDYNTYLTDWEEVERIIRETINAPGVPISELK
ncbi:MAG: hypothetical protein IJ437_04665 [Clostridia bacterium]|nr:hypothetical protein [Clostridia bacterium]